MNQIQDNLSYIEFIYSNGLYRDIRKDMIKENFKDDKSVVLMLKDDIPLSLNYWEFGTIADPNIPYSSSSDLHADISTLLNTT